MRLTGHTTSALFCLFLTSVTAHAQWRSAWPVDGEPATGRLGKSRPAPEPMASPVLGFVYAQEQSEIRIIQGIPGASVLSEPMTLPSEVTRIRFAPGQKYAFVERADAAPAAVVTFTATGPGTLRAIPGTISQPDFVSFSPSGGAAVLYSSAADRLQVISGLPDSPQLVRDATLNLSGAPRAFAVADDGVTVLEATADALYRQIFDYSEFVDSVENLRGIAFNAGSDDALIIDQAGRATLFQGLAGWSPSRRVVADALSGLQGDVILAMDRGNALITSTAATSLSAIDLQTLQVQEIALPAAMGMLQPLRSSRRFLLSYKSGEPAWLLDMNNPSPEVYFVPARSSAEDLCRSEICATEQSVSPQPSRSVQSRPKLQ